MSKKSIIQLLRSIKIGHHIDFYLDYAEAPHAVSYKKIGKNKFEYLGNEKCFENYIFDNEMIFSLIEGVEYWRISDKKSIPLWDWVHMTEEWIKENNK